MQELNSNIWPGLTVNPDLKQWYHLNLILTC